MSGKPWTPERKAAHAARMRERWRAGAFDKRVIRVSEAERAARSGRMKRLNVRMRDDEKLKRKCVRGQKRARRAPAYLAIQAAVMRDLMARPEMRRAARYHAILINKNPQVRQRQWAGRRRRKGGLALPEDLVGMFSINRKEERVS